MSEDEVARAASDTIDARCAANPAPEWQFATPGGTSWFRPDAEAWHEALTDQQRQAIDKGAATVAEATGLSVEYMRDMFIRQLATSGGIDG